LGRRSPIAAAIIMIVAMMIAVVSIAIVVAIVFLGTLVGVTMIGCDDAAGGDEEKS
jgi:hypothetical protein